MLLTNTQVSKFRRTFENDSSANIKLARTQLHKIGQSGWVLDRILGPLRKSGLSLMKNVLKPLAERVLISLGLTAAATYATILKKMFGSGTTASIIFMEEMNYVMKIVKSLEESDLLIKSFSETIKNHVKKQKGGFLRMLLGTLDASIPC